MARLTIRYAHTWYLTKASADVLHLREPLNMAAADGLYAVTEIAETALQLGHATLEMTTEAPGGTSTVQCLTFTPETGVTLEDRHRLTSRSSS